jgi:hypothetical protein
MVIFALEAGILGQDSLDSAVILVIEWLVGRWIECGRRRDNGKKV